jgi:alkylated DNA repair protein (DNA oxidative demethylase)
LAGSAIGVVIATNRRTRIAGNHGRHAGCLPATGAAGGQAGGFADFTPDACLINRYAPGARLSLHQDKNETDFSAPIVSISLGLPATFLFGGMERTDRQERIALHHGDIAVWGGATRLAYHGVMPLKEGHHPRLGGYRINMTFRRAR